MLDKIRNARRHRRAASSYRFAYRVLIARGVPAKLADESASRYALREFGVYA